MTAVGAGFVVTICLASWALARVAGRLRGKVLDAPKPSLLREPDALYRGESVIARVEGVTVDEASRTVHFERLTSSVNILNLGPDALLFRSYQLRCVTVESMTGSPPRPYSYQKVTCNIVGRV
jgi:hypothetical protein